MLQQQSAGSRKAGALTEKQEWKGKRNGKQGDMGWLGNSKADRQREFQNGLACMRKLLNFVKAIFLLLSFDKGESENEKTI